MSALTELIKMLSESDRQHYAIKKIAIYLCPADFGLEGGGDCSNDKDCTECWTKEANSWTPLS